MHKLGTVSVGGSNPVRIMGILNTSPESFYKKSIHSSKRNITQAVKLMEAQGADIIDVGGMSTAPYLSTMIPEKIEAKRITDAIKIIQNVSNLPISIDTCRASVAIEALEFGVEIINDVSGLKYDKQMLDVVKIYQPSLVLCAFSKKIIMGNIKQQTQKLLKQSLHLAKLAGIPKTKIIVDPAIGFFRKSGKSPFFTKITLDWAQRDLNILADLDSFKCGQPLLVSVSNKSFIGKILNKPNPVDRLPGSLAAEVVAIINGADIIRTHNVKQSKRLVTVAKNFLRSNKSL